MPGIQDKCERCPFGGPKVGYSGDIKSPFVIIGESPGAQEVRLGEPFVGPVGELFWRSLKADKKHFLLVNALQCKPPSKKKPALVDQAVGACQDHLMSILCAHPRKAILALGNSAVRSVTGNMGYKITQVRGQILHSRRVGAEVVPAVHPAALLRGTGNVRQFRDDLLVFLELCRLNLSNQAGYVEPEYDVHNEWRPSWNPSKKYVAADIETTGFHHLADRMLCQGVADTPGHAHVFPEGTSIETLKEVFERRDVSFVWHNGKFDCKFLRHAGIDARVDEDTMLLSYCLDETGGVHDLESVMMDRLGAPNYKGMLEKYLPKKGASYDHIPRDVLYEYQAIDASGTQQSFAVLRPLVAADPELEKLYTKVLMPAVPVLMEIEEYGIKLDIERLNVIDAELVKEMEQVKATIAKIYGKAVNPNSPMQVGKMLYDDMGFKRIKGKSTAHDVLEKLGDSPIIRAMLRYRKISKLWSTYVKGLRKKYEESPDGRIHTTLLLHGTRTGRLASRQPNLQNIPRGPQIRSMFVPEEGNVFIEVDLNQAELRSLAYCSGDPELMGIYQDASRSLHHEVAVEFFGEDYTSEEKMRAKAVNFGIVYGREAPSLAYEFDITTKEARKYIEGWFARFPKAKEFIEKCRKAPLKNQTITTPFGRKKRHHIVARQNLKSLMNEASNFPHQSIASDINLCAAVNCHPKLKAIGVNIIILVHDSIIMECPNRKETIDEAIRIARRAMQAEAPKWGITSIPFLAESKIGVDWGHLEDYEVEM